MSKIIRIGTRDSQLAMWQAKTVQSQLEYINMIRNELGIIIPEPVTASELEKLNESVIAELRKRRSNQ